MLQKLTKLLLMSTLALLVVFLVTPSPLQAQVGPEICTDGVDNDGDRKVDCDDKKDCNKDPACLGGGTDGDDPGALAKITFQDAGHRIGSEESACPASNCGLTADSSLRSE